MTQRFDTILKSGTIVNQDGEGVGDIGISGWPDRGARLARPGLRRRGDRLHGPAHPARRDRHPGAFPRAGPDPQGRSRNRLAQRGDGRRHRGVRDAEHQSADRHRRDLHRQGEARPTTACIAISRSSSAAPATMCRICRSWSARRGCAGVKVFIGSSTGSLLVEDDESLRRIFQVIQRRAAFHAEDEYRLNDRKDLRIEGDPRSHPVWRDEIAALMATQRLVALARETGKRIHVLHISTKAGDRVSARPQGRRHLRGDAASSDAGGAGMLRAARHPRADESAGARRRASRRHLARHRAGHRRRARLRPRAAYAGGEGQDLSGLALGHDRRADAGAADARSRQCRDDCRWRASSISPAPGRRGSSTSPARAGSRPATTPTSRWSI